MPRGLRVLLVCGDEDAGHMLGEALGAVGAASEGAADLDDALLKLKGKDPARVVVLAGAAGAREPAEQCRRLRAAFPDRELQVLVAVRDATDIERAVASGADEVLRLPFAQRELEVRLRSLRRTLDLHRMAAGQVARDPLTSLWSHAMVVEVLARELARADRNQQSVSTLLIDVDGFAQINDQHGHRVGDEVLAEVAQRVKVALRSYDLVGRFGGDEFLVVLPNCGRANAIEVAERVRKAVSEVPVLVLKGMLELTLSVGVATTVRERRSSAAEVVRAAEGALDDAKRMGRDRVEVAGTVQGEKRG
jgi:diguanylate cyclase (GGDEF)-like protein